MPCAFRDQAALTWNPTGDTQLPAVSQAVWLGYSWVKIQRNQENSTALEF